MPAVVMDLETVCQDKHAERIANAPFDRDAFVPKNGAKNPDVIARQIEDAEREWEEGKTARIDACGLSPRTGRIVVAGVAVEGGVGIPMTAATEKDERAMLEDLWAFVLQAEPLITYNGFAYDLPFLINRSVLLGVKPALKMAGVMPYVRRYAFHMHFDVRMAFTAWDMRAPGTKAEWAESFGLPAQEISGADVGRLYRAGDLAAIARHCVADLAETWAMFVALAPYYLGRAA